MPVPVRIPTPLRRFTGDRAEVSVKAADLSSLLERLFEECPGLRGQLLGEDRKLRSFVNIYVNDEDVRFLDGLKTAVKDGDSVEIVPAIAGGGE
ncbi:MAG TPA: MoaD/ThiS family protein [Thermoanaerobaculia bacterium]|jgi:molybdopterin synthase sulfur carrier subunit|nr:MoaD/ThiS family protein [Thermoanaerobaculia bacterium]